MAIKDPKFAVGSVHLTPDVGAQAICDVRAMYQYLVESPDGRRAWYSEDYVEEFIVAPAAKKPPKPARKPRSKPVAAPGHVDSVVAPKVVKG